MGKPRENLIRSLIFPPDYRDGINLLAPSRHVTTFKRLGTAGYRFASVTSESDLRFASRIQEDETGSMWARA